MRGTLTRRPQTFRHFHACSRYFRLERLPGGACTHWKAPPFHGAHPSATYAAVNSSPGSGRSHRHRGPRRDPPQQWAYGDRRHTGRLRRSAWLETVRDHHLGNIAFLLGAFVRAEAEPKQSGGLFVPRKEPCRWPGAACKDEFDAFLECGTRLTVAMGRAGRHYPGWGPWEEEVFENPVLYPPSCTPNSAVLTADHLWHRWR